MTNRRKERRRASRLAVADVPAFADFARGYLHQDLMVEYGSALDAARAFVRDATDAERRAVVTDLARLAAAAAEWSPRRLGRWFHDDLRAAWAPASVDELEDLRIVIAAGMR